MEQLVMLAAVSAGLLTALVTTAYRRNLKVRQILADTRRVAIKDFPPRKLAKIVGRVRYAKKSVEAPLSGRRCAFYRVVVFEAEVGKVLEETGGVPFWIEDDSGRAYVDPKGAEFHVIDDHHTRSGPFIITSSREDRLLHKHGKTPTVFSVNRALSYQEGVIEAGEKIAVAGWGGREPDPDGVRQASGGYRDLPPMRLKFKGSKRFPLYLSDDKSTL